MQWCASGSTVLSPFPGPDLHCATEADASLCASLLNAAVPPPANATNPLTDLKAECEEGATCASALEERAERIEDALHNLSGDEPGWQGFSPTTLSKLSKAELQEFAESALTTLKSISKAAFDDEKGHTWPLSSAAEDTRARFANVIDCLEGALEGNPDVHDNQENLCKCAISRKATHAAY